MLSYGRKWKIKYGKALFALQTSIGKEYIKHVRDVKTSKQVWETLETLFTQKNMMRLQFLENELVDARKSFSSKIFSEN